MSASPPRSASFGQRKQSIVERASMAIESKLGGTSLRRVQTTPATYVNGVATPNPSQGSLQQLGSSGSLVADGDVLSMNVDDYEVMDPIGFGSSAIVHIAKYKPTGKIVSIKMIDLDKFERNQIDELRREIQIMSLSKHPQLLPVYGSFVHGSKLYIVTPFLSAGSCLDIMKTAFQEGMDESSIATILKQALEGLVYLHKNGLIHRDVKAGNLLIHEDGLVQLADFGVSSSLMETGERKGLRKTFVGTPCWMAPEVMEQSGYDYKADIWSFGITALELATGHAPFAKFPPIKVLMMTLQNDPPTLDRDSTKHKYSKTFKDMIDMCLVKDPAKRPTAEKLLSHPFFKQAKKRQYLVTALLQSLPPITQRSHNKRNGRQTKDGSYHKGDSWDFSTAGSEPDRNADNKDSLIRTFLGDTSASQTSFESESSESSSGRRGVRFETNVAVVGGGAEPLAAPALVKKSRFIVGESPTASPNTSSGNLNADGSGASSGHGSGSATPTGGQIPSNIAQQQLSGLQDAAGLPPTGEVRKGRFSVNQASPGSGPIPAPITTNQSAGVLDPAKQTMSPYDGRPDGEPPVERKPSRFAVQTIASPASSQTSTPTQSTPTNGSIDSQTRTRGRFEVTTGDKPQSPMPTIDQLMRQNELQRQVLNDIIAALKARGMSLEGLGVTVPPGVFGPAESGMNVPGAHIGAMEVGGVEWLKRENEVLRREVEGLRKADG